MLPSWLQYEFLTEIVIQPLGTASPQMSVVVFDPDPSIFRIVRPI